MPNVLVTPSTAVVTPHPILLPQIRPEILVAHAAAGGDASPAGPRTAAKETSIAGGSVVECHGGAIYWSHAAGAHVLWGKIAERYRQLGGPSGFLGFPTTGIAPLQGGAQTCRFQQGLIVWDGNAGHAACEVHGDIARAYDESGGPLGFLRFPVTDETQHPGTDIRYSAFQHGVIVWKPNAGARVVPQIRLHLGKVNSKEIDDGIEFFSKDKNAELVTYHTVKVNGSVVANNKRAPGDHAGTSYDINADYPVVITPQTKIELQIKADDWDQASGNDYLGSYTTTFDITNFWGLLGGSPAGVYIDVPATAKGGDLPKLENLRFNFSVAPIVPLDATKPFREQYWWRSDNFKTAELSLDQYRDTFRDVGELGATWDKVTHPLNWLYYELAYKHCAAKGNCFGMSLEAVISRIGHSVFQEPLYQHRMNAADNRNNDAETILPAVKKVINERHGWQLGASAVRWLVSRLTTGEAISPLSVYQRVKACLASRDYPVLSMIKLDGFSGHAVLPYRCADGDGSAAKPHKIFVADPNVVWRKEEGDPTYIAIYPNDTFELVSSGAFQAKSTPILSGLLPGVLLVEFPLCRFGDQPRTAVWEILLAIGLLGGLILLAGDGATSQVSSGEQRLFRPLNDGTLGMIPGGIPGLARIPLLDFGPNAPELYAQLDHFPAKLQQSVTGKGGRYQYAVMTKSNAIDVDNRFAAQAQETIAIDDLHTSRPLLTMQTSEGPKSARVNYATTADRRLFTVDLQVAHGESARVGLSADAQSLVVAPAGPVKPFVVEMHGKDAKAQPGRLTITPTPGEAVQLRPGDWNALKGDIVVERLHSVGGGVIGKIVRKSE